MPGVRGRASRPMRAYMQKTSHMHRAEASIKTQALYDLAVQVRLAFIMTLAVMLILAILQSVV